MIRLFSICIAVLCVLSTYAQYKIRPLEQLINTTEPGWTLVEEWISKAKNKVEVLPCDTVRAKDALYLTQVTTRSPMGAIIYATGGLLVDDGWVRILGSGHSKLNRTLPGWNEAKSFEVHGQKPSFLLIADDVVGGFFAINGGRFGKDEGNVYYLAPDTLEWEPLDLTYTDFLLFCFNGNLKRFYKKLRWKNWKDEVAKLDGNMVFNFYPFLWTTEGKNIDRNSRKAVPIEEQYSFNMSSRKQLGLDKD